MDVAITLKLTASEYQTLRQELTDTQNRLREQQKALANARKLHERQALVEREARVTFLLEKLG